ncbi:MAG: hypothetical protein ABIG92_03830 [Candidatus Omnitrophota bacterium]
MKTCLLRILAILILTSSLSSCTSKVSYPKERLEESILGLCQKEYGLKDVKVKLIGSTLGVFIPIEGLVDNELKLKEEASDKIEKLALSVHRVVMSTNMPLGIYTVTARDTDTLGAEFIMSGVVYDIIRVRLLDISRGEYHKRILRDFRVNPVLIGELKIKELFRDLNTYSDTIKNIMPFFYPIFVIGKNSSQRMEIEEMLSKEISSKEALFYLKTKEYYEAKPGLEVYNSVFAQGFTNEYLILINVESLMNPISEIVSRYTYVDGEIRERDLKQVFDQYIDKGYIGSDGLPKKELSLGWFITQTLTKRVQLLFLEDKELNDSFNIASLGSSFDNRIMHFRLSFNSKKDLEDPKNIVFDKVISLIAHVIHRYDFKDLDKVEVMDIASQKMVSISLLELEDFRKGKIKIKDLLDNKNPENPNP